MEFSSHGWFVIFCFFMIILGKAFVWTLFADEVWKRSTIIKFLELDSFGTIVLEQ